MFGRNKKKLLLQKNKATEYTIELQNNNFQFYSTQEITSIIVRDTIEEIRLSDLHGKSDSPKNFLLDLQKEFVNFFSLWEKEYYKNSIVIDIYSKIGNLVPILKSWSKSKYLEIQPGRLERNNRLNIYSDPTNSNNNFGGRLYYPFPLVTNSEHNHTAFMFFEESTVDKKIQEEIYKTWVLLDVSYIKNKVFFNSTKLILKDLELNEETKKQLKNLKDIMQIWPLFATILFNCLFNKNWGITNTFHKNSD